MLDPMRLSTNLRRLAAVLAVGLWAGGALAQPADDSGWFDPPTQTERPVLKIEGKGPYDPPPADFQSDPEAPASPPDGAGYVEDAPVEPEDDEEYADEAEGQQLAVRKFSPYLEPYGHWMEDPVYGRVWVPRRNVVGHDFAPYASGGHWELTADDEWLWVSDYPFGWVTFHYGRWAWLSGGASWGWVPGYRYAPAWVDFRVGSAGYVGWGPLAPYSVWRHGSYVSLGVVRPVPYIFVPSTYVFSRSMPRYVIRDPHRVRSIGAQTYRYRPYRVAGDRWVRSPRPSEARIPSRALPARRTVARPRFVDNDRVRFSSARELRSSSGAARVRRDDWPSRRDLEPRSRRQDRYDAGDRRRSGGRFEGPARERRNAVMSPRPSRRGAVNDRGSYAPRREVRGNGNPAWGNRAPAVVPRTAPPRREVRPVTAAPAPRDSGRDRAPAARAPRRESAAPPARATRREGGSPRASGNERRGDARSTRGAGGAARSRSREGSSR
jgi:uncharacterized protein DUF6600